MSKICRPAMPLQVGIPGGIDDGKLIEIRGRIPFGADRIGINLLAGYHPNSDRALHLSIRFDQQSVIRNHQEYGQWGPEERQGTFPFSYGREFTLVIAVEWMKYRIAVNNQHCWDFRHRMPYDRVKSLSMYGPVDVYEIEFIKRSYPIRQSEDGLSYQPTPPLHSGAYDSPGYSPYIPQAGLNLPAVYNPSVPYAYSIYGGLRPGMAIHISGRPSSNPNKFTINLQKGAAEYPPPDVAFHFEPRFFNRSIARNTRKNGVWASEENFSNHFPFYPSASFDLIIRVAEDRYSVSINGQHFTDFYHRLRSLEMFDTLYIENDVSISTISFS